MADVAGLGVLGQAGGCPEADHLPAFGRGRVVGQHHQPGVRRDDLEIAEIGGTGQDAEVEDRHVRRMFGERDGQPLVRNVGGHQGQAGVPVHQRLQPAADNVLELGERQGDGVTGGGDGHVRQCLNGASPGITGQGEKPFYPVHLTPGPPKYDPIQGT